MAAEAPQDTYSYMLEHTSVENSANIKQIKVVANVVYMLAFTRLYVLDTNIGPTDTTLNKSMFEIAGG